MKWNIDNIKKSLLSFAKIALIVAPFIILYYLYFLIWHDGEIYCFVELFLGIPCMGCGMTRATLHLFSFNFADAFHYHPLVYIMPFILFVIIFKNMQIINTIYRSRTFWISIFMLFVIVYIIRMVLYYPDIEPMTIYEDAYLRRMLDLIK